MAIVRMLRSRAVFCGLVALLLALVCSHSCKPRNKMSQSQQAAASFNVENASLFAAGNRFVQWQGKDHYLGEIQPLLAKRCVACHGCTDSPCSAKLTSHTGLMRGASKANPYSIRAFEVDMPEDRDGSKGFYEVVHSDVNKSLMFQFLRAGLKNTTEKDPEGAFDLASLSAYRTSAKKFNKYECPADQKEFATFMKDHPLGGMPFGLPRLSSEENQTLLRWLAEKSAAGPTPEAQALVQRPSQLKVLFAWESFLNGGSDPVRMRLVSKYLYEHWFNAHIAFEEMPGEFFQLVRSKTSTPGNDSEFRAPEPMVTALPTDPVPKGFDIFYRFKKMDEVITQKNHVVVVLSVKDIDSYRELFLPADIPWKVNGAISYETGNPFANFKDIPEVIRHRFMLEHARYIVDSMVRAPVCTGGSATYAIPDHFWTFFLRPEADPSSAAKVKMSPEGFEGLDLTVEAWTMAGQVKDRFTRNYQYLNAYEDALRADLKARGKKGLTPGDLWAGEPLRSGGVSKNRNAWLSITRHDASTTVQFGQEGGMPQHMWVLSYANFERLYYNLVVNFKFWGDIKHKIGTWRSMSHERLDGEDLFVSMLPQKDRSRVRDAWSGGLELGEDLDFTGSVLKTLVEKTTGVKLNEGPIRRYIDLYPLQGSKGAEPRVGVDNLPGREPAEVELTRVIRDRMRAQGVSSEADTLNARADGDSIFQPTATALPAFSGRQVSSFDEFEHELAAVGATRGVGTFASSMPATVFVRVTAKDGATRIYTMIGNRAYKSHNLSFLASNGKDGLTRRPEDDTISIYRGPVGDHPQLFFDLGLEGVSTTVGQAGAFFAQLSQMNARNAESILAKMRTDFAIQRNSSRFWPFVDWLHQEMVRSDTPYGPGYVWAGILDLSRYDM